MTDVDPVIDLSHHNQPVDLFAAKQAGLVGVIHKATEGTSFIDSEYTARKRDAFNAGLLFGAYHFLRPGDMLAQAAHFVDTAGDDVDLYCADHEDAGVSLDDLKTFLREVMTLTDQERLVIYSGHVLKEQLGNRHDAELARHRLWLAHYGDTPSWPQATFPTWWLWQYTDGGSMPGIGCDVDCNRFDGTDVELVADWTGEPIELAPAPGEPHPAAVTVTITVEATGPINLIVDDRTMRVARKR